MEENSIVVDAEYLGNRVPLSHVSVPLAREATGQIIMDIFYMYKVAWKYKGPVKNNQALRQILFNMLLFVPLGAIVRALTRKVWVTVAIGIGLSVLAEGLQFATGLGFADIDDVISNSVGLLIGVLVRNSNKTLMTARCDRLFSEF